MKKLLALIMCVALLATTGVVFASADGPVTDNFTPAGDFEIEWDPEVSDKIELDGDITDWQDAGYNVNKITTDNLVAWVNTENAVDEDFEINAFYVSDSDFLYVAFWIVDNDFMYSTDMTDYHDGDAFQIAIDFNREMQKILNSDEADILENPKNIFYSFDCVEGSEIVFFRNEKKHGGTENLTGDEGVKGMGAATDGGWCAEFALSWDMLYEDFAYKAYIDEYSAILDKGHDLQLGLTLCYLDMGEAGMTSAAGTFLESPLFTPADNGMSLTLKWQEGMTINCDGIVTPEEGEEYVSGVEEDDVTEPSTEETTAAEEETTAEETTAEETTAEETTAAETEAKTEAKTEPAKKEGGCGSVVATGAAVAVLAAAAAAVALKKKD